MPAIIVQHPSMKQKTLAQRIDDMTQRVRATLAVEFPDDVKFYIFGISYGEEEDIGKEIILMNGQIKLGSVSVIPAPGYNAVAFYTAEGGHIGVLHADEYEQLPSTEQSAALAEFVQQARRVNLTTSSVRATQPMPSQ
jgi:hypothetical protein